MACSIITVTYTHLHMHTFAMFTWDEVDSWVTLSDSQGHLSLGDVAAALGRPMLPDVRLLQVFTAVQ